MTFTDSTGGKRLDLVAGGFSFPTSLTFDDAGVAYVAESGLPFGGAAPGGPSGGSTLLAPVRS